MASLKWTFVCLLGMLSVATSSKILCVAPMPGRSHSLVVGNVCKALAEKGHQVTFISAFPEKKPIPNLTEISTAELASIMNDEVFDKYNTRHVPTWTRLPILFTVASYIMENFITHPNVQKLLNSDQTFDMVLSENFVNEAVTTGLSKKYNVPLVLISPFQPNLWQNNLVGNPAPTSYVPDTFLTFTDHMSFVERLFNTVFQWVHEAVYKLYHLNLQNRVLKKHFGEDLPHVSSILKNTSLVLINHHFSLAYPRPYTPNMVEVAGMHVKPLKPLPKDIQEFMDTAEHGVIFFSLGSNIKISLMPKRQLDAFIEVFGKLKQKVLFKWETDEFPNKPDNIKLSNWFPQSDILGHPNLKLFITHNGLGSTIEAVYRGVPTLSIPIFADQELNARQVEKAGMSKLLVFEEITVDTLREGILEVINNPKYRENVQKRSALLRDRPVSALDTAIYWVEYVLRHNGAHHMRSAAQDLCWFQLYLYDVYFVIFSVLAVVLYIQVCIVKKICRWWCGKKNKKISQEKKKN